MTPSIIQTSQQRPSTSKLTIDASFLAKPKNYGLVAQILLVFISMVVLQLLFIFSTMEQLLIFAFVPVVTITLIALFDKRKLAEGFPFWFVLINNLFTIPLTAVLVLLCQMLLLALRGGDAIVLIIMQLVLWGILFILTIIGSVFGYLLNKINLPHAGKFIILVYALCMLALIIGFLTNPIVT